MILIVLSNDRYTSIPYGHQIDKHVAIVGNRGQSWAIVGNRGQSWAIVDGLAYKSIQGLMIKPAPCYPITGSLGTIEPEHVRLLVPQHNHIEVVHGLDQIVGYISAQI